MTYYNSNDPDEEIRWGSRAIVSWGLAFLLVIAIGGAVYFLVLPRIYERQTDAIQNSPQFVLSGQEQISKAIEHHSGLQVQIDQYSKQPGNEKLVEDLKVQQFADVCEVRKAADLIQSDAHPERLTQRAKKFLDDHKSVVCK